MFSADHYRNRLYSLAKLDPSMHLVHAAKVLETLHPRATGPVLEWHVYYKHLVEEIVHAVSVIANWRG